MLAAMDGRKKVRDWFTALAHFLMAGIFIPFLIGIPIFILQVIFVGMDANGNPTSNASLSVYTHLIAVDDTYGYIETIIDPIINE